MTPKSISRSNSECCSSGDGNNDGDESQQDSNSTSQQQQNDAAAGGGHGGAVVVQQTMENNNNNNTHDDAAPPAQHHRPQHTPPSHNNPMPHIIPEGENSVSLEVVGATATDKLIIIMVGLPASGKTHISQRIARYIHFFLNIPTSIYNVSEYRRKFVGCQQPPSSFYDTGNSDGMCLRQKARTEALKDLVEYMKLDGVRVAVFDAPNDTMERRKDVLDVLDKEGIGAKRIFLETVCNDEKIVEEHIQNTRLSSPDYSDMDPNEAARDFKERREKYRPAYETVLDKEGSYTKVYDFQKFEVNNIRGYLPLKVVHFLMNLHSRPRSFYLSRHGQSKYNVLGKIGGDAPLSPAGLEYAKRLAQYAKDIISVEEVEELDDNGKVVRKKRDIPARLWTSTLRRTKETVQYIEHPTLTFYHDYDDEEDGSEWIQFRPTARRNLDELYAGVCDGMTYHEIAEVYPDEFQRRQRDKLAYRYPRGESYMDCFQRIEPLAHDMERTREPILIVAHQGILRIIYAYFMGLSRNDAPFVNIPLNTVIKLTPHAYGCKEERVCLMDKKEMLRDGQDEPVTSMPMTMTSLPITHDDGGVEKRDAGHDSSVVVCDKDHHGDDPVMNAPGC